MSSLFTIQRSLDLIEAQLKEPLRAEKLARSVGMSVWYFHRTFSAMVGESVAAYIRRRRLHEASRCLREGDQTILDVAIDFQFESHAAFTRAFKAEAGLSPSRWREQSGENVGLPPVKLSHLELRNRFKSMTIPSEIVTLPRRTFIGLQAAFTVPSSPNANNLSVIPALWDRFETRAKEIPDVCEDAAYGLSGCPDNIEGIKLRNEEALYLASLCVKDSAQPPKDMRRWTAPEGTYAKFIMKGKVQNISATMGYIYGRWMPESGYMRANGPDIERMDDRFDGESDDSILEIFIPVAPVGKRGA